MKILPILFVCMLPFAACSKTPTETTPPTKTPVAEPEDHGHGPRKPIGPTFFASFAPASPCSQTDHSNALSGSAPRASRPPTIPASTSPLPETPRPGAPPSYLQHSPAGVTTWLATPFTSTSER